MPEGTAPYNFVPLPKPSEVITFPPDTLPNHNNFLTDGENRLTGEVVVEFSTLTPLYVRGMLSDQELRLLSENKDKNGSPITEDTPFAELLTNKPNFFHTSSSSGGKPIPKIPGSSIRGMLRTLIEIVGYGKFQNITDKQLFYRSVGTDSMAKSYRDRMVGRENGEKKVETGFLTYNPESDIYQITVCEMCRVHHNLLPDDYLENKAKKANATPNWKYQYKRVYVHLTHDGKNVEACQFNDKHGGTPGILVITGWMRNGVQSNNGNNGKQAEFVFLLPKANAEVVDVPEDVINQLNDQDQISQWQQRAFPKDQPEKNSRKVPGQLPSEMQAYDQPIFFLREATPDHSKSEVSFLGRAQMFRLPYLNSPFDLVSPELKTPSVVDFAEAIFGFVRTRDELDQLTDEQQKKSKYCAYKGRIDISDGQWINGNLKYHEAFSPKVLSSPKPTAFQYYLQPDKKGNPVHYDSDTLSVADEQVQPELRGYKLYWHQGNINVHDHVIDKENNDHKSTQHTMIQPLEAGNTFEFTIHFENLSNIELGLLLWVIELPDTYKLVPHAHKLGMGKSYGLGSVELNVKKLVEINRVERYQGLFTENQEWVIGQRDITSDIGEYLEKFEKFMLEQLSEESTQHFVEIQRIKTLMRLLEWQVENHDRSLKKYEGLSRDRNVLRSPLQVGTAEPTKYPYPVRVGQLVKKAKVIDKLEDGTFVISLNDALEYSGDYDVTGFMSPENQRGKQYMIGHEISIVIIDLIDRIEEDYELKVDCEPANY